MPSDGSNTLSVVAAQLVEAACSAIQGDGQLARARIERAVALLHGNNRSVPIRTLRSSQATQVVRGGLVAWQSRRVVAHIEGNLASTIHVDELAKLVGLSESHFSRAFKCSFGLSAHAYVMRRRIEMAQGLMISTREPLSQIALNCGLTDQAHFCRLFRRLVGETPNGWRRTRLDAITGDEPTQQVQLATQAPSQQRQLA